MQGMVAIKLVKVLVVLHVSSISGKADLWQLESGSRFSLEQKIQSSIVSVYFDLMCAVPTILCFIFRVSLLSLDERGRELRYLKLLRNTSWLMSFMSGILLQYIVEVSWFIVRFVYLVRFLMYFVPFLPYDHEIMSFSLWVCGTVWSRWKPFLRIGRIFMYSRALTFWPRICSRVGRST